MTHVLHGMVCSIELNTGAGHILGEDNVTYWFNYNDCESSDILKERTPVIFEPNTGSFPGIDYAKNVKRATVL